MINVEFTKYSKTRTYKAQMTGHADAAPKGFDIICSAASQLAFTLMDSLDTWDKKGVTKTTTNSGKAGDLRISTKVLDGSADSMLACDIIYKTIYRGYKLLADKYPMFISLKARGMDD